MWTRVAAHTIDGITVGVSRNFRKGEPVYSVKFGVLTLDANGRGVLNPNIPHEPARPSVIAELAYMALASIEEDARAIAEAESARVANLAAPPKANQLDRKGLKQIGKTAKKKAKRAGLDLV
jgi:hypothetical protein